MPESFSVRSEGKNEINSDWRFVIKTALFAGKYNVYYYYYYYYYYTKYISRKVRFHGDHIRWKCDIRLPARAALLEWINERFRFQRPNVTRPRIVTLREPLIVQ